MTGLSGHELRRRATGGVAMLSARGALVLVLGVFANLALARMLMPSDFGLVALGTVFVVFGNQLAQTGLGAWLIRRDMEPTARELEAMNAAQLAGTTAVVLAVAAAGALVGRDGLVVATMAASLPIVMLRGPAIVVLERQLRYREIATVDVVEAVAFYAWSLGTVALGMGVWGVATGMLVRATSGTATMAWVAPVGLVRPRWSWPLVRPLIAFGAKFQAISVAAAARDQGLNVAVAAVAGIATLGIWNLAQRILQIPAMLVGAVGRVAYPAISRLLESNEDPAPTLERGAAMLAVVIAAAAAAVAAFAPAIPALTGNEWADVPATLLWASISLVVGPPIVAVAAGYLTAVSRLGTIMSGTLAAGAGWFAVTLSLVAELGAPAVGIGAIAAAFVNAGWLARAVRSRTGARLVRSTAAPATLGVLSIGAGWVLARSGGSSLAAGAAGVAAAEVTLLAGLLVFRRPLVRETYELLGRTVIAPLRVRHRDATSPT